MPDHNGPCRFGHYNHLQRVIFDRLGFKHAEIITPSNNTSYQDLAGEHSQKFRFNAWKGFVAVDFLRKLLQETRPYEITGGDTDIVYYKSLDKVVHCIESGTKGLHSVLSECTAEFSKIKTDKNHRKPIVSVIGETYMRDNAFCNGNVVRRLEDLGIETLIGPFSEWITYSTYRFTRDSLWKMDMKGYVKSKIQGYAQDLSSAIILRGMKEVIDHEKHIPISEIMNLCNKYVHKDYDGDPPIAMGTAAAQVEKGISGIAAILPFTCMPGTLVAAVSDSFRKDHKNIPWINIAYDGQDTVTLETRLQAFAYQVKEFAKGVSGKREETQIPKELTEQLLADNIIADIQVP